MKMYLPLTLLGNCVPTQDQLDEIAEGMGVRMFLRTGETVQEIRYASAATGWAFEYVLAVDVELAPTTVRESSRLVHDGDRELDL